MTTAYPETNAEVIEKALYCLKHGETESVENWLELLRERLTTDKSRADALTDEHFDAAQKVFHSILVLEMSELCDRNSPEDEPDAMIANDREMAGCIDRTLERTGLVVVPRGLLAASAVEQRAPVTAQTALAAIETFEIVGENNDSREPNADDRFILTEFIAHLFGGVPVEQHEAAPVAFDILAHLQRQRDFSERTFGPGARTAGICDHIRKELKEIEANPGDLTEWIDVVILALDGAWRAGGSPQQIVDAIVAKQTKNEGRTWPDWHTVPADKAIEHDRSQDACQQCQGKGTVVFRDPEEAWDVTCGVCGGSGRPTPSAPLEGTGNGADERATEDVPTGAIVNGRTLADRLEAYPFESEGGDLRLCSDWVEFRRCFEHLAEWVLSRAPRTEVAGAVPIQAGFLTDDRKSEIARKCEVECHASPGTNMWQCAYMAIEETINALAEPHLSTWIAEVCEDADGYKHIEPVIEDLDDLPKGMRLYGAPQSPSADAAAAPADERAAFDSWARGIRMDVSVSLEGHYTDAGTAYAWASWRARAAASQPAAAVGQESAEVIGIVHRPAQNGADFSIEWLGSPPAGAKLYTAPPAGAKLYTAPPEQVATRQGLTVRQRMDLLLVADDMEVSGDAKLANALRALLEGAKQ